MAPQFQAPIDGTPRPLVFILSSTGLEPNEPPLADLCFLYGYDLIPVSRDQERWCTKPKAKILPEEAYKPPEHILNLWNLNICYTIASAHEHFFRYYIAQSNSDALLLHLSVQRILADYVSWAEEKYQRLVSSLTSNRSTTLMGP